MKGEGGEPGVGLGFFLVLPVAPRTILQYPGTDCTTVCRDFMIQVFSRLLLHPSVVATDQLKP